MKPSVDFCSSRLSSTLSCHLPLVKQQKLKCGKEMWFSSIHGQCPPTHHHPHPHTPPSVRPAPSKQTKIISLTHSHWAHCTREQSLFSQSLKHSSSHPVCEYTPRQRCRHSGLFECGCKRGHNQGCKSWPWPCESVCYQPGNKWGAGLVGAVIEQLLLHHGGLVSCRNTECCLCLTSWGAWKLIKNSSVPGTAQRIKYSLRHESVRF